MLLDFKKADWAGEIMWWITKDSLIERTLAISFAIECIRLIGLKS